MSKPEPFDQPLADPTPDGGGVPSPFTPPAREPDGGGVPSPFTPPNR